MMEFLLTLKKVAHVMNEDILISPSRSSELTNGKTIVDLDETINSYNYTLLLRLKQMIYNSGKRFPYGNIMIIYARITF